MVKHYESWAVESSLIPLFEDCMKLYRENHPELNYVEITRSKFLYEIFKFYLNGTKYRVVE